MNGYKIGLIFDFFFGKNIREALDVKTALESYGNEVFLYEAKLSLMDKLLRTDLDFAFNLARNTEEKKYTVSIASICELLEIKLIGPKVLTATITTEKEVLFKVLEHEGILTINSFSAQDLLKSVQASVLGDELEFIFVLDVHDDFHIKLIPSNQIRENCMKIFNSIQATDYCEFLFFFGKEKQAYLADLNPIPYLDSNSNLAIVRKSLGFNYDEFINTIILNAVKRFELPIKEKYETLDESIKTKKRVRKNSQTNSLEVKNIGG